MPCMYAQNSEFILFTTHIVILRQGLAVPRVRHCSVGLVVDLCQLPSVGLGQLLLQLLGSFDSH